MKTKAYILRHSETNYNVERRHDHEWKAILTEGWEQRAKVLSVLLWDQNISAIYSSPLPRCINTVTPLVNILEQEVIIDERIRESFFWPIQDKLWNDFPRDFLDEIHNINGESHEWYEHMRDVKARVSEFIDSVVQLHQWETIVICSHGWPIIHILSHIDKKVPNLAPTELMINTWVTHQDAYVVREI